MAIANKAVAYCGSEFIRASEGGTRDILNVLLNPETNYTEAEVNALVTEYLKKEVMQ